MDIERCTLACPDSPTTSSSHHLTISPSGSHLTRSLSFNRSGGPPGGEVMIGLAQSRIVTSRDGIQFTTTSTVGKQWRSCVWNSQLNVFVVVGQGGYGDIMTSPDGFTWTVSQNQPPNFQIAGPWKGVTYGGGKFVAVGGLGSSQPSVAYSTDGLSWTEVPRASLPIGDWFGVAYGGPPGAELFVAVSQDGPNDVMTSPDGVSWTARPSPLDPPIRSVAWGNGAFMAVSSGESSSGGPRGMVSSDGITWVPVNDPVLDAGSWMSVIYAEGHFVGVGYGRGGSYAKSTAFYTT